MQNDDTLFSKEGYALMAAAFEVHNELGGGLLDAISEGTDFIVGRRKAGGSDPILLTGYSRGAAGAVAIAKKLQRKNLNVNAMLLFDCVDRHLFIDAEVIPNNVENVFHVVRSDASGSRESFGHDGLRFRPTLRLAARPWLRAPVWR